MFTLHIEHPITDYVIWREAFDGFGEVRRQAGVLAERVARPVEEPDRIIIDLDFETAERAERFRHFLETQIWASAATAPALAGTPTASILELAPPTAAR